MADRRRKPGGPGRPRRRTRMENQQNAFMGVDVAQISPLGPLASRVQSEDPAEVFDIYEKIGDGSFGEVFRALDKRTNEEVALKVMKVDPADVKDLVKEIDTMKEMHDLPSIVNYGGTFQQDGKLLIAMEYCAGGSIADIMEICGTTLTELQAAAVSKLALEGLHALHSRKRMHRDLKAGNLLLTTQGQCKLADFGAAASLSNTMSARMTVIGTPYWMAPEVMTCEDEQLGYNAKADIWSFGITVYEMLMGKPPHFDLSPLQAIRRIPTASSPALPDTFSATARHFVACCLKREPKDRPNTAALMRHPFVVKLKNPEDVLIELLQQRMKDIENRRVQETDIKRKSNAEIVKGLSLPRSRSEDEEKGDTVKKTPTLKPPPVQQPNEDEILSYEQLRNGEVPASHDHSRKEMYLCDAEFSDVFQMSKEDFYSLPDWKRVMLKRKYGLF